jgi:hypothetical protein
MLTIESAMEKQRTMCEIAPFVEDQSDTSVVYFLEDVAVSYVPCAVSDSVVFVL